MTFPKSLPPSRVPDPMEAPVLRWGILGSGWIAEQFIASVRAHTRQEIAAIGSRSSDTAQAFARKWSIPRAHGSYEDLVGDDGLDVVYVATPHNLHRDHVLMALEAGRNVLVEKPMALDHAQAVEMVTLARARGLFLAEALWTYFLPKFDVLSQVLDSGALGEIRSVHTEYGEHFTRDHRIFDPALAGGPLLDLGTYPVSLLSRLLGPARQMVGLKQDDPAGVHGQLAIVMANAAGNLGMMATTLYGLTPTNAAIVGTGGTVRFGSEFNLPGPFRVISADGATVLSYEEPAGRHFEGLFYEAAEVARCIASGATETPKRPLDETLAMMEMLDMVRATVGFGFDRAMP
ncbi:Gfo/Idh/MocA family protein [Paracoccus siganidrum]|uniref:Gfo/Idh/MocA family oxidoreductase n=1 Tax=Paracoccus siganidrum TaxID=1276757 RepID=A0A419A1E9_9RHOB|nr:Gfo/Idh/MocA family oxidoreductase [Paracoccus siganidrum]RJL06693.1 gfo/Idh/MocA family oxidoreductase [Paracoccus siganidrum]RMC26962.1 gfo/Idh/MocA family oxidoreductase [Paracoccus siganidrum]